MNLVRTLRDLEYADGGVSPRESVVLALVEAGMPRTQAYAVAGYTAEEQALLQVGPEPQIVYHFGGNTHRPVDVQLDPSAWRVLNPATGEVRFVAVEDVLGKETTPLHLYRSAGWLITPLYEPASRTFYSQHGKKMILSFGEALSRPLPAALPADNGYLKCLTCGKDLTNHKKRCKCEKPVPTWDRESVADGDYVATLLPRFLRHREQAWKNAKNQSKRHKVREAGRKRKAERERIAAAQVTESNGAESPS